jgi:hypothetical protein
MEGAAKRNKERKRGRNNERPRTTLGSDHSSFAQSSVQQLKVGLLEQRLGGAFRVGTVGDDHIELVLVVSQKLEAVANVDLDVGVLETNAHAGEVFLGDTDDSLSQ